MPALTPSSDLAVLESLSGERLRSLFKLLEHKSPRKSAISSRVPDEFLRLLYIYVDVLGDPSAPNHLVRGLTSIRDWFEATIPGLKEKPGFAKFIEAARSHMEAYTLAQDAEPLIDQRLKSLAASVGNITDFSSQPSLTGPDYTPTLRVFLFSDEHLLLDSTGEWNDWLYLSLQLITSINEQARGLPGQIEIGDRFVSRLTSHLDGIEENVKLIRQFLVEHAAGGEPENAGA